MAQQCPPNGNQAKANTYLFTCEKLPIASKYVTSVNLPQVMMGDAEVPNRFANFSVPGGKLTFNEVTMDLFLDEDYEVYMEVYNWIMEMADPHAEKRTENSYSDAHLTILNSQDKPILNVKFWDMFPTELDSIQFTTADADGLTLSVTMKYSTFTVERTA